MKILYHHRTRSADGQTVHITGLVDAFRALGHEVVVVGPPGVEDAALGSEGRVVTMLRRRLPGFVYELLEVGYSFVAFRRLRRRYRDLRPDILYERYNLYLLAGRWLKQVCGVPLLLEVNAPLVRERSQTGGLAIKWLARWAERLVWRSADYVLPVTQVLAQDIRAAGVEEDRIVVMPNGASRSMLITEFDGSTVRRRLGFEGRIVLGFSGFVRPWHGLDLVIDMMADKDARGHWHLLILGDGPALPDLRRRAQRRGIADRVTFAGVIERDRVAMHIAAFDIALQPRVVPYASPLKLFEYMALGRAIVAPDMANIREVLIHEQTALLFDPGSPDAFRAAVERLARDEALRERLGKRAQAALMEQDRTWDGNARRIVELAGSLVGSTPASAGNRSADPMAPAAAKARSAWRMQ